MFTFSQATSGQIIGCYIILPMLITVQFRIDYYCKHFQATSDMPRNLYA